MRSNSIGATIVVLVFTVGAFAPARGQVGTVSADYSTDNTALHVQNLSTRTWTNVVLSGVGVGGQIDGVTGTLPLGTIAPGATRDISFSAPCGGVFAFDFDECSRGSVNYTLNAAASGYTISAQFSPAVNASGGFVPFLGNDANGVELDSTVARTVVANLYFCGDAVSDPGEACDDGNAVDGDGCDSNCTVSGCGNGILDPGEECDDGNANDSDCCSNACHMAPDATSCDDQLFCNGSDSCMAGVCVHSGDPCAGGAECQSACDEPTDTCTVPVGTPCTDDGNPCTFDQCSGGSCQHPPNDFASCDDGVFCNGADRCFAGSCMFHNGDPCSFQQCSPLCDEMTETCDPIVAGTACFDDGDVCTRDECDGAGSCGHPPAAAGIACPDDGLVCTADQCDGAGSCGHPPLDGGVPCPNDGNVCTSDICDGIGLCVHPPLPNGTPCDDTNACTQTDRCQGGMCVGADPVVCPAPFCGAPPTHCDPGSGMCTSCPVGYTAGNGGCQKTYLINSSDLVNLFGFCDGSGVSRYNGCGSAFGFHWTDTADGRVGAVSQIDVALETGIDCNASHTLSLNGSPLGVYASTSSATCACSGPGIPRLITQADPQLYVKGGVNSVSISASDCAGLSAAATGSYAVVAVTYGSNEGELTMRDDCREAGRSRFRYKNSARDSADTLQWKWAHGEATTQAEFGNPTTAAEYQFCVYGETSGAPSLLFSADLPPDAVAWSAIRDRGYAYADQAGTRGGVTRLLLKQGGPIKSKVILKAKGAALSDPTLPLAPLNGLRVQLTNQSTNVCWESKFSATDLTGGFNARSR